jgi:signal peptidase I
LDLTAPRRFANYRPRIRTLGGAFASIVAGLIVGSILLAVAATTLLGYRVLDLASSSMEPALHRGDLILSRPAPIDEVKQGDIVVFQEGEQIPVLVAHRVAAINDFIVDATSKSTGKTTSTTTRLLRTKGDANSDPDAQPVDAAHYRGIVWFVAPGVGTPFLDYPVSQTFFAITAVTAAAWALYELIGLVRRRRERRRAGPAPPEHVSDG